MTTLGLCHRHPPSPARDGAMWTQAVWISRAASWELQGHSGPEDMGWEDVARLWIVLLGFSMLIFSTWPGWAALHLH